MMEDSMETRVPPVAMPGDAVPAERRRRLERMSWHNWMLLLATTLITTVGLTVSVGSLLTGRELVPWAWSGSEITLLAGLSLVVALFGWHLTRDRRRIVRLQNELDTAHEEAVRSTTRHYNRLMAVFGVSQAMASESNLQAVFDSITQSCFGFFDCDRVSLMLKDRKTNELEVRAAVGFEGPSDFVGTRQPIGQGVAGWVAEHKEPLILGEVVDSAKFSGFEPSKSGLTAALVVPIVVRDELVGVISLSSRVAGNIYTEADLRALQVFGWNAGFCIRHAEQAEWMRQTIWKLEGSLQKHERETETALRMTGS
jgi:transcriptional regulator with GAF, ATPase, and Fis domain